MFRRIPIIGIAVLAVTATTSARGQTLPPYYLNAPTLYIQHQMQRSMLSTRIFNGMMANEMLKVKGGGKSPSKGKKAPTRKKTVAGSTAKGSARPMNKPAPTSKPAPAAIPTTFKPETPGIVLRQAAAQGGSEQQRRQAEEFFNVFWDNYVRFSSEQGYASNDVARALSYFIGVNYKVQYGTDTATPPQVRAVYNQVKRQLTGSAEFRKMDDRKRQELTEMLVMMAGMSGAVFRMAEESGDQAAIQKSRELSGKSLEAVLGLPTHRFAITDRGLEPR